MAKENYPVILTFCIIMITAMCGCSPDTPQKKIKNVLLISMDTTRADHLSCYGFDKKTTPAIDAFADEAVLFKNAFSTNPITMPAHSSMLTGTIPPYHGVHTNYNYVLGQSNVTLAEILKENGFKTSAIVSTFVLDSQFGLDQGFDTYNDTFETTLNTMGINERGGGEASRIAMEWMEKNSDDSFFLFLHYYDPHKEYAPPEPFSSEFSTDLYSGEIAYTDYSISKVIKHLKTLKIYDSTLIIITGDHGEMLGEHKEKTHGYYIYRSAINVPLIIRIPGQEKPKKVDDVVSLIDITPTVCSLLGIPPLPQHKGMDLSPYLLKDNFLNPGRNVFSESMTPSEFGANSLLGVTTQKLKYLETTKPELYDLEKDPREIDNIVQKEPDNAKHMEIVLKQIIEDQLRQDTSDSKADLDEESIKRLESLGYIAGSSAEDLFEFDRKKEDAKDIFPFYRECSAVNSFIISKDYDKAKAASMELLKNWPDKFKTHNTVGQIAVRQRDYETAAKHYLKSIELNPDQHRERSTLANILIELKRDDEAVIQLKESIKLSPETSRNHYMMGKIMEQQGKKDEALKWLKKALRINQNYGECYLVMGKIADSKAESEKAFKYLKKAIELKPKLVQAHINLGTLYRKQNRFNDAIKHYFKALKINPFYSNIYANIGETLSSKGCFKKAIAYYDAALKIDVKNKAAAEGRKTAVEKKQWTANLADRFRAAIKSKPADSNLHSRFGNLIAKETPLDALIHFKKALEIDPENKNAGRSMAWLLATHPDSQIRNADKALKLAEKACPDYTCDDPTSLDILAAAYASADKFDRAEKTALKALDRIKSDTSKNNTRKAGETKDRLNRYQNKTPYHDGFIAIPAGCENILEETEIKREKILSEHRDEQPGN